MATSVSWPATATLAAWGAAIVKADAVRSAKSDTRYAANANAARARERVSCGWTMSPSERNDSLALFLTVGRSL